MNHFVYKMPFGNLTIVADDAGICRIIYGNEHPDCPRRPSAVTNKAANQLLEYFACKRKTFDVPLSLKGTDFQLQVWNRLLQIPYGETRTYAQIAEEVGKPKAYRAVGMANNKNPVPLIVPCHRVIGSNGTLVGYAYGLKIKKYLLDLESSNR